jgi:hypothetical protein
LTPQEKAIGQKSIAYQRAKLCHNQDSLPEYMVPGRWLSQVNKDGTAKGELNGKPDVLLLSEI